MENSTMTQPINLTELKLIGILDKVAQEQLNSDPDSTAMELPTSYDSTSTTNNIGEPIKLYYNRKVARFAKKHKLSYDEAFKRLYK